MKNFRDLSVLAWAAGAFMLASCSNSDNDALVETANDAAIKNTIQQYVDKTVVPVYENLADEALHLQTGCRTLQQFPVQVNVDKACEEWISARRYWELSEAFLYGAAADYNIDPHIDSWPLDKTQLDNLLVSSSMDKFDANYAGTFLGYGLLGFHAVEYVLFRDGKPRDIADIQPKELIYAAGVAEDLCRQCIRLEASWAGIENISAAKQTVLTETELEPAMNYGEAMITAGESGNMLYKTQLSGLIQILQGCTDIADEVGNTKISDPVNSGNVLDVESWYSWNSIADYADNIRSIQYAYFGGMGLTAPDKYSVSTFLAARDAELDKQIKAQITKTIFAIEGMPAPFRNNLVWNAPNQEAKSACNELMNLLDKAITLLQK